MNDALWPPSPSLRRVNSSFLQKVGGVKLPFSVTPTRPVIAPASPKIPLPISFIVRFIKPSSNKIPEILDNNNINDSWLRRSSLSAPTPPRNSSGGNHARSNKRLSLLVARCHNTCKSWDGIQQPLLHVCPLRCPVAHFSN